jgi:flagellar basal body rod protein FlgG
MHVLGQGYYTIQTNPIRRTYTRNGIYKLIMRLIPSKSNDTSNVAYANETVVVTG